MSLGVVVFAIVLVGCGTSTPDDPSTGSGHVDPRPTSHSMPGMAADRVAGPGPSMTATMVCGGEIRGDVAKALESGSVPAGTSTWSAGRQYVCTFATAAGPLVLAVNDATSIARGVDYYGQEKARLAPTQRLIGLASFGLPAFETTRGVVAFLKDGKTLKVDATSLRPDHLPSGQTRLDVAYAVAADVIGCWSE